MENKVVKLGVPVAYLGPLEPDKLMQEAIYTTAQGLL